LIVNGYYPLVNIAMENGPFIVDRWFIHVYPILLISGWWCNNHLEKYESQWEGLSHILWKIKNV
jgi:hypothetical protein